jgi:hypothetical protein
MLMFVGVGLITPAACIIDSVIAGSPAPWAAARQIVAADQAKPAVSYQEEAVPVLGRLAYEMHCGYPAGTAPRDFVVKTLSEALRAKNAGLSPEEADKAAAMGKLGRFVPMFDHLIPPDASWENFKYAARVIREICCAAH